MNDINIEKSIRRIAGVKNLINIKFRILSIVAKYGKASHKGMTVEEIEEQYEKEYSETLETRRTQEYLKAMTDSKVLQSQKRLLNIDKKTDPASNDFGRARTGRKPNEYIINNDLWNSDTPEGQKTKYSYEILKDWFAINQSFDFFPVSQEMKDLIDSVFEHDDAVKVNEWIEITSLKSSLNQLRANTKKDQEQKDNLARNFHLIFWALSEKSKLNFKYENKSVTNVIPCLIKEHRGKWYLLSCPINFLDDKKKITWRLDKISDVDDSDNLSADEEILLEKQRADFKTAFESSLGIFTEWHNSEIKRPVDDPTAKYFSDKLEISFKLKDGDKFDNISYIKMDKIHHSQTIGRKDKNGYNKVTLRCFPDADLVREIRKLGRHNVKELNCKWLKQTSEAPPNLQKWVWEL